MGPAWGLRATPRGAHTKKSSGIRRTALLAGKSAASSRYSLLKLLTVLGAVLVRASRLQVSVLLAAPHG